VTTQDIERLTHTLALEIASLKEAMTDSMTQWSNGLRVRGALPLQLSRAVVSPNLFNGNGKLMGWTLRVPADAGAAGSLVLKDGDADGEIIGQAVVAVGASSTHWLAGGVNVGRALYAEVTGVLLGAVYFLD
jgi:hypothetical protein